MIINDLDDYYIVFDTKNRNTELDTLIKKTKSVQATMMWLARFFLLYSSYSHAPNLALGNGAAK